jgi:hypothetical protein
MRLSLVHLLNGQLDRYSFQPMYGERFMKFLTDINNLGLEELQERRDALAAASDLDVKEIVERTNS